MTSEQGVKTFVALLLFLDAKYLQSLFSVYWFSFVCCLKYWKPQILYVIVF